MSGLRQKDPPLMLESQPRNVVAYDIDIHTLTRASGSLTSQVTHLLAQGYRRNLKPQRKGRPEEFMDILSLTTPG